MDNEYELIYLYEQGEEDAFLELVKIYEAVTRNMIHRFISLYYVNLEERDLYQLSIITLYRAVSSYHMDSKASFLTYYSLLLERDLKHECRCFYTNKNQQYAKQLSLNQTIRESEGIYLIDTVADTSTNSNPREKWYVDETWKEIQELLAEYKKEEQNIFYAWLDGYTYKEIAAMMSSTVKNVEYVIRKIRNKIKVSIDYQNTL